MKYFMIIILTLLVSTAYTSAQYQMRGSSISNGGGQSTGAIFAVKGTIAQPDAGKAQGAIYQVLGGFHPGEPFCFVDLEHFARFAYYWMDTGIDLPADLYADEIVDEYDLAIFLEQWLNYCPLNWKLR